MTSVNKAGEASASACLTNCPAHNRQPNGEHTDSAKRCADGVNLHIAARGTEIIGKWVVVKLLDGSVEHTVYDHQSEAVGAMWPNEREYAYMMVPRQWVTLCEAESYMRFNRLRYEAGMNVMPDPRDVKRPGPVRDVIRPLTRTAHDQMMASLGLQPGKRIWRP